MCGGLCLTPVDAQGLSGGVAAVASGGIHTCALTTAGGVKCWGDGSLGQLGDDFACFVVCPTPVNVVGLGPKPAPTPSPTATEAPATPTAPTATEPRPQPTAPAPADTLPVMLPQTGAAGPSGGGAAPWMAGALAGAGAMAVGYSALRPLVSLSQRRRPGKERPR